MPKQFKPEMGYPMSSLLEGLSGDLWIDIKRSRRNKDKEYSPDMDNRFKKTAKALRRNQQSLSREWSDIFEEVERWEDLHSMVYGVRQFLNTGVCITKNQFHAFVSSLDISHVGNPNDEIDLAHDDYRYALSLAVLANSFRLSCGDCLNVHCEKRDPDFPVKEVQARLHQIRSRKDSK